LSWLSKFSAMFVFGDSLVDNGNNNYLISFAKANFVSYGIDTSWGPTGRFSNGKILIDLLGELLGHPYLPSFTATQRQGKSITWGVNYASAAAGILDETETHLGQHITFKEQVHNFQTTINQLKATMDDIGPLGCTPHQISTKGLFPSGACRDDVNSMIVLFNDGLKSLVDELNTQYNGSSIFVYGNTYGVLMQIIQDPIAYGKKLEN
ncbi:hypothetical protein PIB30_083579, partial [Stylosanthes scabra]|nr:hypothetical protein [Stylosanthes scabra]